MNSYRALVVGCGSITRAWLDACRSHFSDRFQLVGFVDIRGEAAAACAAEYGPAWVGESLQQALAELKPDVVFNCTIPEAHAAVSSAALLAGCHVLTEKPLTSTLAEASGLVELAATCGRMLAVIQNQRYRQPVRRLRSAFAAGIIGEIHTANVDFYLAPHFGGFREEMRHVLLLDMAIHTFDLARYLSGLNPCSVFARDYNPPRSWFAHGASAHAIFELEKGAFFNYRGSWCADGLQTAWAGTWRFIGTRGTLTWDGEDSMQAEVIAHDWDGKGFMAARESVEIADVPSSPSDDAHAGVIKEFLHALDTGALPSTIASDNIRSLAMVECAIRSAESGLSVAIEY